MSQDDADLEDDIRRLAEARATEVHDVPWRDRLGGRRRPWGLVAAAAAALVALVVGGVVVLTDDDPADTEVAGEDVATSGAPSTTAAPPTTAPATTTGPDATTGPARCAAEPPEGVLDRAVHLDVNRTPLDLDLDGEPDELLTYEDDDTDAWVIARTAEGWTTPAFIGPAATTLVYAPSGFPAGADLDGDGGLEFFVTGVGNTARNVAVVSTVGCDLVRVPYGDDGGDDPAREGLILVGAGGTSCAPIGCHPRVRCVDERLIVELADPVDAGDAVSGSGTEVVWSITTYELVDGALVERGREEQRFVSSSGPGDSDTWPPDAPDADDSDVVDCLPPPA